MKRAICILLAVILLFSTLSGVSAANNDRITQAFAYLVSQAKAGQRVEAGDMLFFRRIFPLAQDVTFEMTYDPDDEEIGLVIEESSSSDAYHKIITLVLQNEYWLLIYGRDCVNGYYLNEPSEADDERGPAIGDYGFFPGDFTGTAGMSFNRGYTGKSKTKQEDLRDATLGVNDILTLIDSILSAGGYTVKDLGFTRYSGHAVHRCGRNIERVEPNCTENGFERGVCYICRQTQEKTIPAFGHQWKLTKTISESTNDAHGIGQYVCKRCGETKQAPLCACEIFADAPKEGNWAHQSVDWALFSGITNGTSETTFSPEETCTRAQIVTFLWRAKGSPDPAGNVCNFTDVSSKAFYYKAVLWAQEQGITNGISETMFGPERGCTRAQVVTFLWRAEGKPHPESADVPFLDVKDGFYTEAVLWASEKKITNGLSESVFGVEQTCTRAQIVTFLYRDLRQKDTP